MTDPSSLKSFPEVRQYIMKRMGLTFEAELSGTVRKQLTYAGTIGLTFKDLAKILVYFCEVENYSLSNQFGIYWIKDENDRNKALSYWKRREEEKQKKQKETEQAIEKTKNVKVFNYIPKVRPPRKPKLIDVDEIIKKGDN